MIVRTFLFVFAALCAAFFVVLGEARADIATSSNFKIERGVIDIGGSRSTSTSFDSQGSIGQPGTGISTSTSFILQGGFLFFGGTSVTVSPSSTPSATSTPTPGGNVGVGAGAPPRGPSCDVDLNDDGVVDIADFSILLYYFGNSITSFECPDFNGDGIVDMADVSILLFYWNIA